MEKVIKLHPSIWGHLKGQLSFRAILYIEDPHCHWCRCFLEWPKKTPENSPNSATVDHLITVDHPMRLKINKDNLRMYTVLACGACNSRRGHAAWKPRKDFRGKSVSYPKLPEHLL